MPECMYICHVCQGALVSQKRASEPTELALQVPVSLQMWVLGTKCGLSGRAEMMLREENPS